MERLITSRSHPSHDPDRSQGGCNLFNREDNLHASLRVFASHGVQPKLILMLRSPVTHAAAVG